MRTKTYERDRQTHVSAIVTNEAVENCLRKILAKNQFSLSSKKAHGETGVDILATKRKSYYIEVIGYKKSAPMRARDFYEVFFRAISRLNQGAKHCIIALSNRAESGLPVRAQRHRVAWLRIADAFPELEIWLVNVDEHKYKSTTWREWANTNYRRQTSQAFLA